MRRLIRHIINPVKFRTMLMTIVMAGSMLFSPGLAHGVAKDKDKDPVYTIVIDAGHGGKDFGAMDNGQSEKMINLGVAKKLAQQIKKNVKNVKVVLTRDDDTFISLQGRADIANFNKADLFISIHTNSVDKSNPNRKKVAGATVYTLGHHKDANNLKVAQTENSVIEYEDNYHQKYSGFDPNKDESYIIFEMAQKRNLGKSLRFAAEAQKELVATGGRVDRGVKQAGFWVLWATSMPSVLVELDFICNPTEAAFLGSDEGQERLAKSLCNAVKRYFSADNDRSASAGSAKQYSDKNEQKAKSNRNSRQEHADAEMPAKAEESENAATMASTGVGTLVSVENAERVKIGGKSTTTRRSASGPRKRRSSSSRAISDKREIATDSIALKSETQYLARHEATKDEVKEEVNEPKKEDAKGKKNKKKKNKSKDTKAKETKSAGMQGEMMASTSGSKDSKKAESSSKKSSTRGNRKTFVVKQSGNNTQAQAAKTTTKVSAGKSTTSGKNVASGKTIAKAQTEAKDTITRQPGRPKFKAASASASRPIYYKIQLAESDHKLNDNDPLFGGLTPTEMFVENNHYKYTYGSSTNRREMEKKLLEIKSMVPNAIIIVDNEK